MLNKHVDSTEQKVPMVSIYLLKRSEKELPNINADAKTDKT